MDATNTLTDRAAPAAAAMTRVVVPTDVDDARLTDARIAATRLAADFGWELVLYDRSEERWTDTPHPTGPLTLDEVVESGRQHLIDQMRDVEAAGVSVRAWLATVPSITAMLDAIQELDVDGVMVPTDLQQPRMMDRLLEGGSPARIVDRVTDLQLDRPGPVFLVVADDGSIDIDEYSSDDGAG